MARTTLARCAAAALLVLAATGAARAADDKEALRQEALKLNRVTGDDPIKGKIRALAADEKHAKALLAAAGEMAKEKDQPFNYNASFILARIAQRLKDLAAGEAFYQIATDQALKLRSGSKLSQAFLGHTSLLVDHKKFEESEKLCKKFLEKQDDASQEIQFYVIEAMLEVLTEQDKADEAKRIVNNLIKERPDSWLLLELKANVLRRLGDSAQAARLYEEVLGRVGRDENLEQEDREKLSDRVRYVLSNVYVDLKKIDKAAGYLKDLLKKEPDNPTYNNDLGFIWADHDQNLEESEKLIRKALDDDRKKRKEDKELLPEEDRDNGAYLDSLGWVLFKQKKFAEAKKYLLEAVKDKEAQHIEIYDHLADVHLALGEKKEAVAAWKKGLEVAGKTRREKERKTQVEEKLKKHE